MRQRLEALRRLGAVYELVEEMHSMEARVAAQEASAAENAVRGERSVETSARQGEREAMRAEDSEERSARIAQSQVAEQRRRQLEPLLEKRQKISDAASTRHKSSRLWSERMKSLIENEASRIATVEERRQQISSDDRFLARRGRSNKTKREAEDESSLIRAQKDLAE
ncbi:MAG TPA: hypothetical protein VL495_03280 [Edaphobacter sp.]|jgi:hypothetical protein|nr:hypothetical protein [Edaphobacter sp.]